MLQFSLLLDMKSLYWLELSPFLIAALPHPIEGSWDEEILRKALAQRNIRLLVFISYNQHGECFTQIPERYVTAVKSH